MFTMNSIIYIFTYSQLIESQGATVYEIASSVQPSTANHSFASLPESTLWLRQWTADSPADRRVGTPTCQHSSHAHSHIYLANKEICLIKVSPHKSGCFPRYGFNLNAHFLAFACSFHSFMVNLQAGDHTKITELQAQHTCGVRGVGCKRREDIGYKGDCQITQDMSHLSVPLLWGPSGECPASPHLLELPLQRQWGLSCWRHSWAIS